MPSAHPGNHTSLTDVTRGGPRGSPADAAFDLIELADAAQAFGRILNKPPRKGDAVSWRIGEHLIREADCTWRVEWEQEKTGCATESGAIQMEVARS